jgi:intracellular septation protein
MNQGVKLAIEMGPLVAFFIANWQGGIYWGTAVFMAATAVALAASWMLRRKLPIVPLISAAFVGVFGALTLWLHDATFIKVKVTLINALFGLILLGGLWFRQSFLKLVMGEAIRMSEQGWRKLTVRWGIFFFVLAIANEIVWRTQSTDVWVNFKVFGILPLSLMFALLQAPMMSRYMEQEPPSPGAV